MTGLDEDVEGELIATILKTGPFSVGEHQAVDRIALKLAAIVTVAV